jgi:glutamine synthetase
VTDNDGATNTLPKTVTVTLTTPINPGSVLFPLQSGYPADLVFDLTVDSINGVRNQSVSGGEFRPPDPSANPYLAFSAMLMAGLDGIQNKIDPGKPLDKDIYAMSPEESKDVPKAPGSLDEALKALERDHAFLLKGDVFTSDVIQTWIDYKRENEVDPVRLRPHPAEFALYFDA